MSNTVSSGIPSVCERFSGTSQMMPGQKLFGRMKPLVSTNAFHQYKAIKWNRKGSSLRDKWYEQLAEAKLLPTIRPLQLNSEIKEKKKNKKCSDQSNAQTNQLQ